MIRSIVAWLAASGVAYIAASVLITQFNIAAIGGLGQPVEMAQRISSTLQDLKGMAPAYLPLIAIGFAVAFPIARYLVSRWFGFNAVVCTAAGFVAVLCIHLLFLGIFGLNAFAPVRTIAGLFAQCVAGALGGYLFFRLVRRPVPGT